MITTDRITIEEAFKWLKDGHKNLKGMPMSSIWSEDKKDFLKVFVSEKQKQKLDGHTFESASRMNKESNLFEPVLDINLNEENDVPEIRLGDKEIKNLRRVEFNWETKDENGVKQPTRFLIEYIDDDADEIVRVQLNGGCKNEG